MSALQTARLTPQLDDGSFDTVLKAKMAGSGNKIYIGALVAWNSSGYLVPFSASTTLRAAGVLVNPGNLLPGSYVENDGSDGDVEVPVGRGTFKFVNAGDGGAVAQGHVGTPVYGLDDQTVTTTSSGHSLAGLCVGLDGADDPTGAGVWVAVGMANVNQGGAVGPTGATGPTGPAGPTGPQGPTGA